MADFFNPQSAKQIMINWTGINHIHFLLWQVRPSSTLPPKKKDGFMETQTNNRKTISKKTRFPIQRNRIKVFMLKTLLLDGITTNKLVTD